ncbi:MAG: PglZ domain-containing protein, partial [Candidatus Poribacteria bacterium]
DFSEIRMLKQSDPDWRMWTEIYVKLSEWDIEFDKLSKTELEETHLEQKRDCNALFSDYVERHYTRWLKGEDSPMLSVDVMDKVVAPLLQQGAQIYFIVLDCLRLDQWLAIEPLLQPYFHISRDYYYSILPTATLYARNALFSGLFPKEIADRFPQYWQETSEDETNTNRYEKQFMKLKLENMGLILKPGIRYFKIFDARGGEEYLRQVSSHERISLAGLVVNFIDILTHKRSQLDILQQIAPDEAAFRSLTKSWFMHSLLFEIMKIISQKDVTVILTSDHGSILSNRASKAFGSRETSTSLRFKVGNSLGCNKNEAIHITEPEEYKLPAESPSKNYILAKEDFYFVYPNQFHEYKRQFQGGFQHGGVSMEEMIVPLITMTPKKQV